MANCLMQLNQCGFPNCSQHFANQYDLTAHIEYTHIPVIEEDVKRKKSANLNNGEQSAPAAMNLPLSYYSRVFRTAYRPNPIKPEPLKVSFNHYKRRSQRDRQLPQNQAASRILRDMMARQGRHITVEEAEKRLMDVDFEECGPENNEVRYRCAIVDCNKRYKSMFVLRVHMKIVHNVMVSDDAKSLTNYPSEDTKPNSNISALQQSMQQHAQMNSSPMNPSPMYGTQMLSTQVHSGQVNPGVSIPSDSTASSGTPTTVPSNGSSTSLAQGSPAAAQNFGNPATNATSFKCSYCAKRYKTSSGLSNHMMSSHQKISDVHDAPSPQIVEQLISQVRMQKQEQSVEKSPRAAAQQATTQSVASSSGHTRTYSVTTTQQPVRYSQQHYQVNLDNQPSTGQVLQMQMQHQKRLKQMQEQQAQQAQVVAATGQQHQHQQGMPVQQGQYATANIGQMGQTAMQSHPTPQQQQQQQQQQLGQMQQQYSQMSAQQQQQQHQHQHQQNSPYSQQMHQMGHQNVNAYQQYHQHQQSPQFPPYQQPSPQNQQSSGPPPQRSPVPLSQSLPPLNSMTQQRQSMQQMPPSNNVPMQYSPTNSQGFNMMSSPSNNQQMSSQPPPYNP